MNVCEEGNVRITPFFSISGFLCDTFHVHQDFSTLFDFSSLALTPVYVLLSPLTNVFMSGVEGGVLFLSRGVVEVVEES